MTVDDTEVGHLGADLVLKHTDNPSIDLSKEAVRQPGFRVWINRDTLKRKRLRLADSAYDRANDSSYSFDASSR